MEDVKSYVVGVWLIKAEQEGSYDEIHSWG